MASSPGASTPGSESHHHNGNADANNVRKRKRKTFSCDPCRKRKLKCDREFPICSRCSKSGNAAFCVYETVPPPLGGADTSVTPSRASGLDFSGSVAGTTQQHYAGHEVASLRPADRIAALESKLAQIDPLVLGERPAKRTRIGSAPIELLIARESAKSDDSIYGSGFRTAFFGPSSERSISLFNPAILRLYPEFKVLLVVNGLHVPSFAQLRNEAWKLRKTTKAIKKLQSRPQVLNLFDILPEKDMCRRLVGNYWYRLSGLYNIIHESFWKKYWDFWEQPIEQRSETFACKLLLMMACMSCIEKDRPQNYRGMSSTARDRAIFWVEACEAFIQRSSRKHLTLESFQIRVLVVLAKQLNSIKRKESWERAQALMAFAISTGLHQNPAKIDATATRDEAGDIPLKSRTSPYEREMRRRLWAAIVEIELQASIERGVPSSRMALFADCGPPTLLRDDQFDETCSALPAPKPREEYTQISYLHLSQETVRLRVALTELVNTQMNGISYEEMLANDDEIKKAIAGLPRFVAEHNDDRENCKSDAAVFIASTLLEVQLRQFQLMLHVPFARRVDKDSRNNLSRMACIDTAARMLHLHGQLTEDRRAISAHQTLNFLREDSFKATMALCYNLSIWRGLNTTSPSSNLLETQLPPALLGLSLVRAKVLALGEHYAQLWHSLAALSLLRSAFHPPDFPKNADAAAVELADLFSLVVNHQDHSYSEQTAAGALTALATPTTLPYDQVHQQADIPPPYMDPAAMPTVEGGAWAFDELWPFSSMGLNW